MVVPVRTDQKSGGSGRLRRFEVLYLHDMEQVQVNEPIGHIFRGSRLYEPNYDDIAAQKGQLGMHDVIVPTVGKCQTKRPKGLAPQKLTDILRCHRCSQVLVSSFLVRDLSLDRASASQGDIEIAHGGDEHGQKRKAVDSRAEEEGGEEVAMDQADDAVEGPKRRQKRNQGDRP